MELAMVSDVSEPLVKRAEDIQDLREWAFR